MEEAELSVAAERPEEEQAPAAAEVSDTLAPEPEQLLLEAPAAEAEDPQLRAAIEAIVYVTDEPVTAAQLAGALGRSEETIKGVLAALAAEYDQPEHGIAIREIAGGYKMASKPEYHEPIRAFAKSLKPPLKLSLAALETLATIAYKQPITAPEIMAIRGVQGAGVLKTLLERKLIATAGRKNVVGRPILYKTTREFLVQFGLNQLSELPTLKEFEELRRLSAGDSDEEAAALQAAPVAPAEPEPAAAAADEQTAPPDPPEPDYPENA